ncbi:GH-E family nuclease [Nocardia wallacei]|uniref:GH-E family nuclease n=1 Tax=Nocardia wallacei TaxID=480035 RepID=UPI002457D15D|nr:GH-E family nuclease [Nocardia wallacei]
MNDLLLVTQQNHDTANTASTLGAEDPGELAFPIGTLETYQEPTIPKFYGGESAAPFWWGAVSSFVEGHVWPNGHQDTLRAAATAFGVAATAFDTAAGKVPNARGFVAAQDSDEIPQIVAQANILETEIKSVAAQFRDLGQSCADYATALDEAHSKILHELAEFAAWAIAFEAVGWAAAVFTGGASAAGGTAAAAARAAITGSRIARICEALAVAAEASALPSIAAAGASARTITALTPLLAAETATVRHRGTGPRLQPRVHPAQPLAPPGITGRCAAGHPRQGDESHDQRRAVLRQRHQSQILVPVAEKYNDPSILKLPKDERGWYYVDNATGKMYPVDSKPVFGHEEGHEWWRIRDMAIQNRWTRQQLLDYANNPDLYRIEDAPGNWSHMFEKPK